VFFLFFLARYDEGTAFMPVVELKRSLPESDKFRFMALDEDGYDCPADWFVPFISKPAKELFEIAFHCS
jgi:hypothetical protein